MANQSASAVTITGGTVDVQEVSANGSSQNVECHYSTEALLGGAYFYQGPGGNLNFAKNQKLSSGTGVATQTSGGILNLSSNQLALSTFSGATIGTPPTNAQYCVIAQYAGIACGPYLVSQLPAASSYAGYSSAVSDSTLNYTSANIGNTVVGGGSNYCKVFSNGTNWVIG
jgi:hypothetical protein